MGLIPHINRELQSSESCVFIQRRLRGILARRKIERMRLDEMKFLGMTRVLDPNAKTHDQIMEETREKRKLKQKIN